MSKINIVFLSGKRGGYDAMVPLLKLFQKNKKIKLTIIATDQHTQKKFGNTYLNIQNDFGKSNVLVIKSNQINDTSKSRSQYLSLLNLKLSKYFTKEKIDLFIVYGDRAESLIATITCNNFEIPVCHFQGGDISGNVDEKFRHAITKLSNIHFVSNLASKNRLIKMGENRKLCFNFGDSHVDALRKVDTSNKKFLEVKKKFNLKKEYIVFLLHPESFSRKKNYINSTKILNELKKFSKQIIAVYPCTDFGYQGIIQSLINFRKSYKKISIYKNIKYEHFINILKKSILLIGNSSSGIIESAYLKLPVLNIGTRQINRLSPENVYHSSFDKIQIRKKLKKILYTNKKKRISLMYGTGLSYKKSYKKILGLIGKIDVKKRFHE